MTDVWVDPLRGNDGNSGGTRRPVVAEPEGGLGADPIADNVFLNPAGSATLYDTITIANPAYPPPGTNIPSPARADDGLNISGNIFWNRGSRITTWGSMMAGSPRGSYRTTRSVPSNRRFAPAARRRRLTIAPDRHDANADKPNTESAHTYPRAPEEDPHSSACITQGTQAETQAEAQATPTDSSACQTRANPSSPRQGNCRGGATRSCLSSKSSETGRRSGPGSRPMSRVQLRSEQPPRYKSRRLHRPRARCTLLVDTTRGEAMSESGIAKVFKHGRSQAVRYPWPFVCPVTACGCVAWRAASCSSRSSRTSTPGSASWTASPTCRSWKTVGASRRCRRRRIRSIDLSPGQGGVGSDGRGQRDLSSPALTARAGSARVFAPSPRAPPAAAEAAAGGAAAAETRRSTSYSRRHGRCRY